MLERIHDRRSAVLSEMGAERPRLRRRFSVAVGIAGSILAAAMTSACGANDDGRGAAVFLSTMGAALAAKSGNYTPNYAPNYTPNYYGNYNQPRTSAEYYAQSAYENLMKSTHGLIHGYEDNSNPPSSDISQFISPGMRN